MTELNNWLKSTILNEFENVEVKDEWGNLIVNGNTFMLGENTNPYLLYKYSVYWEIDGKNGSCSLGENYDTDLLRQLIETKLGLVRKQAFEKIETEEKIEEKESEFTGGLFDFM